MKKLTTLPGYSVYEYLLIFNPHEDLCDKITKAKKAFSEKFKVVGNSFGKPNLALVQFKQYGMADERIINRLKIIAMGRRPIKVEMKDYGSLPTHSIFINITSKMPIQSLVKDIRTNAGRLMKLDDDNKPHFMMEPNMIIARKLQQWQYEKGWLEYSHRQFTGRFIADAMLLLKRPAGEKRYEIAARFAFENLPVNTVQGALF